MEDPKRTAWQCTASEYVVVVQCWDLLVCAESAIEHQLTNLVQNMLTIVPPYCYVPILSIYLMLYFRFINM